MTQTSDRPRDVATAAVVAAALLVLCSAHSVSAGVFYLTDPVSSKTLSLTPEYGAYHQESWASGSRSWSNSAALSGDISGTSYEFHIYAASLGSTSFQADILVNAAIVATTSFSATSTTSTRKIRFVTGVDPMLTGPASLELRITHVGGSVGSILWGDLGGDDNSFIRVPDSPVPGPGDYNGDGTVDAADYVVWRKGLGTSYTQNDYNLWRTHFGQTAGSGSGASANSAVPEPATLVLLIFAAAGWCLRRGCKV